LVANGFTELVADDADGGQPDGPLGWAGYDEDCRAAKQRSGEDESVLCGHGTVGGTEAVLIAFDFRFLGGSVGTRAGLRIEQAFAVARAGGLPVLSLIATGGSRMQEGMLSLVQLHRIARQAHLTRSAGLPHVSVLRDPATGGLWASLGAGADVVIGVAGAQVGFAGHRVRPAADAGDPAYTAEGQYARGHVDEVTDGAGLRDTLASWLTMLQPATGAPATGPAAGLPATGPTAGAPPTGPTAGPPSTRLAGRPHETPYDGTDPDPDPGLPRALGATDEAADGWTAVRRARDPRRPRAAAYLRDHFDEVRLIRGDRTGGVDPGMLCGIGRRGGRSVAFAAQTGTANTPAGFRTAARLIRLADRLSLPVLTLVDTPGAANDAAAERAGVGPALAELFGAVAAATVPMTSLVIGEGGSGGALALAAPGRTWITPDGYFSVTAPELAASILKRPPAEVPVTAEALRIRPAELVELGVVRGIAPG
jgi:acetyl-CoA carboxylase carboxyl transferase subunit beta